MEYKTIKLIFLENFSSLFGGFILAVADPGILEAGVRYNSSGLL